MRPVQRPVPARAGLRHAWVTEEAPSAHVRLALQSPPMRRGAGATWHICGTRRCSTQRHDDHQRTPLALVAATNTPRAGPANGLSMSRSGDFHMSAITSTGSAPPRTMRAAQMLCSSSRPAAVRGDNSATRAGERGAGWVAEHIVTFRGSEQEVQVIGRDNGGTHRCSKVCSRATGQAAVLVEMSPPNPHALRNVNTGVAAAPPHGGSPTQRNPKPSPRPTPPRRPPQVGAAAHAAGPSPSGQQGAHRPAARSPSSHRRPGAGPAPPPRGQ